MHTKKRDCTVAVPLLEAFALPNHIEQQREAHADMYERIYTFIVHMIIDIHIPRTSYVAMFCYGFESCEVSRNQNKALMTPVLCLQLPTLKDIIPRRGLITGAKVVKNLQVSKFFG